MSEAYEQRGLFSRLPDDPAYWRDLTEKVVDDGRPQLAELGANRPAWWSEMARFSRHLAVGAAAAVLAIVFLLPGIGKAELQSRTVDTYGLIPADPLAVALASGEAPPSIEMLIALQNTESER